MTPKQQVRHEFLTRIRNLDLETQYRWLDGVVDFCVDNSIHNLPPTVHVQQTEDVGWNECIETAKRRIVRLKDLN
jgi:hypothetical protein